MILSLGPLRLTIRPVPTVALLVLMPLLLWLGVWQLERGAAKQALLDDYAQRLTQTSIGAAALNDGSNDLDTLRYRTATLEGRFDPEHQILLDNQLHAGSAGYQVFTPLRLRRSDRALLVNRGWLPVGASRARLPDLSVSGEARTVHGRIDQPATPGIRLAMSTDETHWPMLVQYIDYERLSERLGLDLYPMILLLDPNQPNGYERDWTLDFGTMTPQRHLGYAVQWFALAATLFLLYLVSNTRWKKT